MKGFPRVPCNVMKLPVIFKKKQLEPKFFRCLSGSRNMGWHEVYENILSYAQ